MPHLSDAALAAALDPNGGGAAGDVARAHAADCAACAALLERARTDDEQISSWLTALDHPTPSVDPRVIFTHRRRVPAHRAAWWAAVATLAGVTAAAAAVAPRSTLHRVVEAVMHPIRASHAAVPSVATAAQAHAPRGVEIVPDGAVEIRFSAGQRAGSVRVARGDGPALRVEAAEDRATYAVGHDQIIVTNRATDSADYRVTIPSGEHLVRISVAAHTIYTGAAPAAEVALPLR